MKTVRHLVYGTGGALWALPFDPARPEAAGTPVTVVRDVVTTDSGAVDAAVARNGTLAYVAGDGTAGFRQLVWTDLKGTVQTIDVPPGLYNDIRISPDGTRLAYALGTTGAADIWVYSFTRRTSTRLTFTGVNGTQSPSSSTATSITFVCVATNNLAPIRASAHARIRSPSSSRSTTGAQKSRRANLELESPTRARADRSCPP